MIAELAGRAMELVRREGVSGAIKRVVERRHRLGTLSKQDPLSDLSFVSIEPFGAGIDDSVDLVWFVPPYGKGSGGHTTLFRYIGLLEERGWRSHICLSGPGHARTVAEAERQIRGWFPATKASVSLGVNALPSCRIALATGWQTAYPARAFQSTLHRAYFVQDFEPWFWPAGSVASLAEATYRFGFPAVTMGDWLATMLAQRYRMATHPVGFSYDRDLFFPAAKRPGDPERPSRVFFYARPVTPRRGFELGVMALHELKRRHPEVQIVAAGWSLKNFSLPFTVEDHGVVEPGTLGEIIRTADVALVISHSNVSLLPLEVMGCGVPLVTNDDPWSSWLVSDEIAATAPSEPMALASALSRLIEHPEARAALSAGAATFAATTSWEREADRFASHLDEIANSPAGQP